MDIRWLKTFILAAKYENLRKASEELFLTQPAVTKHIQRLEEHLNTQLFNRKGKSVTLTAAGYAFLPYAKNIVSSYENGRSSFESWKQGYHRKLTIAAAPQIASSFLPSLLRAFIDENPDMEVLVNIIKSYEIGEEVSTGKSDLGLTRLQPFQNNLTIDFVHEEPVILVGPNQEVDWNMTESIALSNFRLITHNQPDYENLLLNEVNRYYPTVRTLKVNQVEATKKFIEHGLGVSYLPYSTVKEELEKQQLSKIKMEKISPSTAAIYALTKVKTNETNSFIEFLKDSL